MSSLAESHSAAPEGGHAARWRLSAEARARCGWLFVAGLLYLAFAVFLTWPMAAHLSSTLYSQNPPGDPIGSLTNFRDIVIDHQIPFFPGTLHQLGWPEGQPIPWVRNIASAPGVLVQWLLTLLFGGVGGLALFTLLGYVSTGVAMFAFMRRLTGSYWVSLLCGWAYAFYPFAAWNGLGHTSYIFGSLMVLALWRMVELQWSPTGRNATLAALSSGLAMWFTPYFILMWGVGFATCVVVSLVIAWRDRVLAAMVRLQACAVAAVVVFLGVLAALSLDGAGAGGPVLNTNGIAEFNAYSARIAEYLLPDAQNPIVGHDTAHYLAAHIHGSNPVEATLYVGITTLLLSLVAVVAVLRRRITGPLARAAVMAALVGLVAAWFSAPPQGTIGGVTIDFPSHFVMIATSTWRVYSRFVVVVMLGVVTLAGIGLDHLARGRRRELRWAVLAVASVLVVLDLWARLPQAQHAYRTATPPVYRNLAREPGKGLVAEYPLVPNGDSFYWDQYYQSIYRKPAINGYDTDTVGEHRALSLAQLSLPTTPARLAALGVKWIVLEKSPPAYGLPSPGLPTRGVKKIQSDWWATLFEVTARPSGPALPAVGPQFGADEAGAGGVISNWLEQPTGTITLAGRCMGCRGILSMKLTSFAQPRMVTISGNGHVLWRRRVAKPVTVRIPLTYPTYRNLRISADPGPQSVAATIGGADDRSVSVYVTDLQFGFLSRHG